MSPETPKETPAQPRKRKNVFIDPSSSNRPSPGSKIIIISNDDKDEQKLEKPITPKLSEEDLFEEVRLQVDDIIDEHSVGLKRFIVVDNCSEWRYFARVQSSQGINQYLRGVIKRYQLPPGSFKVLRQRSEIESYLYELSIAPAAVSMIKANARQITITYAPKIEGDPDSDSEIIPSAPSPSFRR